MGLAQPWWPAADPGISFHYPALHCFHYPASLKPVTIRSPWAPLLGLSCVISTFCNRPLFAFDFWKNYTSEGKGAKLNAACETDQSQKMPFFKSIYHQTCGSKDKIAEDSLFLSWSGFCSWYHGGRLDRVGGRRPRATGATPDNYWGVWDCAGTRLLTTSLPRLPTFGQSTARSQLHQRPGH